LNSVDWLNSEGFSEALNAGEISIRSILLQGSYELLFASLEGVLGSTKLKDKLLSNSFEAGCVSVHEYLFRSVIGYGFKFLVVGVQSDHQMSQLKHWLSLGPIVVEEPLGFDEYSEYFYPVNWNRQEKF